MPTSNSKKKAKRKARTPIHDLTPFTLRHPKEEEDEDDGGVKEEQSEKEKTTLERVARKVINGVIDYMDPTHYLTSISDASKSGHTHAFMLHDHGRWQ